MCRGAGSYAGSYGDGGGGVVRGQQLVSQGSAGLSFPQAQATLNVQLVGAVTLLM